MKIERKESDLFVNGQKYKIKQASYCDVPCNNCVFNTISCSEVCKSEILDCHEGEHVPIFPELPKAEGELIQDIQNLSLSEKQQSFLHNLIEERWRKGFLKYGTTTDRTDLSTPEWEQHCLEEILDGLIYARKADPDNNTEVYSHLLNALKAFIGL